MIHHVAGYVTCIDIESTKADVCGLGSGLGQPCVLKNPCLQHYKVLLVDPGHSRQYMRLHPF
jgi:hypothetical protein